MDGQLLGRVTWFNEAKGYGEIISENNQVYFFTYKQIRQSKGLKTIKRNAVVCFTFEKRTSFGLPVASNVRPTRAQLELKLDQGAGLEPIL